MNYSQAVIPSVGEEKLLTTVNFSLSAWIHRAQRDQKAQREYTFYSRAKETPWFGAILQAEDVSCILYTACFRSSFLHASRETLNTYSN